MAFAPTWTLRGSGEGPARILGKESITLVPVTLTFGAGDTYVTGGMSLSGTLPDEISERSVDFAIVLHADDGTRYWFWDGTNNKLKADDAFSTEEGNGTAIAGVVVQLLLGLK